MATAGTSSGTTVHLPGVTAEFHQPDHYIPTRDDLAETAETIRGFLPSPQMGLWLGGLGALAALSVIEWPVAAAIGAGTVVAAQTASSGAARSSTGARSSSRGSARSSSSA